MQAGVLGEVNGSFEELESIHRSQQQDGTTFTESLQVRRTSYTDAGDTIYHGEAAIEVVDEEDSIEIDPDTGNIAVTTSPVRRGKYTEFIVIPDTLMVVDSGDGEFAFDLLRDAVPGIEVSRASIDLNTYADEYYTADDVDPWQVGFYGNIGRAEKGVVYGEDVFDDEEIGELLERSQLNQLGLKYEMEGYDMKMTMARSGYVEVYQPSNLDTSDYAEYLAKEITDYIDHSG